MDIAGSVRDLASVDLFSAGRSEGTFVGRPFYLDYSTARLLVADAWKRDAEGIPQGCFLLAFYENEANAVEEALLLRAIGPTRLPTDDDVVASMVEYYKDDVKTSGADSQIDQLTRYEFSFSGLECRILGTFYKDSEKHTQFGADVENFYSANNYRVFKPPRDVLEVIANLREGDSLPGCDADVKIGVVRYSSTRRFQSMSDSPPVYVSPADFLGKRTALFGMTRTGKSNTVKKIVQATMELSSKAASTVPSGQVGDAALQVLTEGGLPVYKVGQIIFDINGEYSNANLQDEGTAIFEKYTDLVDRYSVLEKPGFRVMKVNFFTDILTGFELVRSHMANEGGDYVRSLLAIDLTAPDSADMGAVTRHERKVAAYFCCLYRAGFAAPQGFKVRFSSNSELKEIVKGDPSRGFSLEEASNWFENLWDCYNSEPIFVKYKVDHGHEWADEDLKALLVFLTRKTSPGGRANVSGFRKIRDLRDYNTPTTTEPFEEAIVKALRGGGVVMVDLSQGNPEIQSIYSERICRAVFADAMNRFISNCPNNFVQVYFEEAHNLFPKKEDKDLSDVYVRIAKEGAKLNLGLIYATQEVSSVSTNILKNTQNWFVAHLNNDDELREIKKYYDFADFAEALVRFSASSDKGFVRMKTYSNPFIVPVQVDRFTVN